jgi:hypothetical protein
MYRFEGIKVAAYLFLILIEWLSASVDEFIQTTSAGAYPFNSVGAFYRLGLSDAFHTGKGIRVQRLEEKLTLSEFHDGTHRVNTRNGNHPTFQERIIKTPHR